jgi:hypothetical protein
MKHFNIKFNNFSCLNHYNQNQILSLSNLIFQWSYVSLSSKDKKMNFRIIVFRSGPVAGSVQDPVTKSPGSIFFKKSKRHRFSKKKKNKSQRVATEFLTKPCQVNLPGQPCRIEFFLFLFFLQPSPVPTLGRPTGLSFKTMFRTIMKFDE